MKKQMPKNFKLRRAMQENALSADELAQAADVHRATVQRMLVGYGAQPSTIRRLCVVLQRTPINLGFVADDPVDLGRVM